MAKFFISFRNGDYLAMDDEGIEAPNIEVARVAAIISARELVADSLKYGGGPIPDAVIVTDEGGQELMTISIRDVLPESLKG
jgi:hypothetical protein